MGIGGAAPALLPWDSAPCLCQDQPCVTLASPNLCIPQIVICKMGPVLMAQAAWYCSESSLTKAQHLDGWHQGMGDEGCWQGGGPETGFLGTCSQPHSGNGVAGRAPELWRKCNGLSTRHWQELGSRDASRTDRPGDGKQTPHVNKGVQPSVRGPGTDPQPSHSKAQTENSMGLTAGLDSAQDS